MNSPEEAWVTAAVVSLALAVVFLVVWYGHVAPARRRVAATLAHFSATEPAQARVLHARAHQTQEAGRSAHTRLLLEVYRPGHPTYRASCTVVLAPHQAAEAQPGHLIDVRVDKMDPATVFLALGHAAVGITAALARAASLAARTKRSGVS